MNGSVYICAASLCSTLIICAILRILSPSGSTQKIMSVVISVFSLCCLASPFYEFSKNINKINAESEIHKGYIENFNSEYDSKVVEKTAGYVNEYINSLLESCSVENSNIETILSTDESRGIYIKDVNIYLNGSENANIKEISDVISSAVGVKPNITERKYE